MKEIQNAIHKNRNFINLKTMVASYTNNAKMKNYSMQSGKIVSTNFYRLLTASKNQET